MRVRFGEFTFDRSRQELRRGAEVVRLPPKAMRLLEVLLEHRGEVVSRGALFERVWPDVTVSEASLKNLVSILRNALDDHERQGRFVHNVHDRGYRFAAVVTDLESGGAVVRGVLRHGGRRIRLRDGTVLVGRGSGCELVLDHPSVSRRHARITVSADGVVLEDLASRNGTHVDGARVEGSVPLAGTMELRFGSVVVFFSSGGRTPSTQTSG